MQTLEEFKSRGGFVANVPFELTHILTRTKTIREPVPPSPDCPEGTYITHEGPETLAVEMGEGQRVVRFRSLQDFQDLRAGTSGLAWEQANPDLCMRVAQASRNNRQPGAIYG
jgi:hypothetical protein